MKNKFLLTLLFVAAIFATSCSKTQETDTPDNKKIVTFNIPALAKATTYATVPAEAHEKETHDLNIYMFDKATKALKGKFVNATYDAMGKVTLDFTSVTATGDQNFYFLLNAASSETSAIADGDFTDEASFVELLTKVHATGNVPCTVGKSLLMTGNATMNIDLMTPATATLVRRVARFDIDNKTVAGFKVTDVVVANATTSGYTFGEATKANAAQIKSDGNFQFAKVVTAGTFEKSVFYMYPTNTNTTEIAIHGELGSEKIVLKAKYNIAINANTRYILRIVNVYGEMSLEVVPADWEEEIEVPVAAPSALRMYDFKVAGSSTDANLYLSAYSYVINNGDNFEGTLTFTVYTSSVGGVEVMPIQTVLGTYDPSKIVVTQVVDPVMTYSKVGYKTDVTVKVGAPAAGDFAQDIVNRIVLRDKSNTDAQAMVTVYFSHATSPYYPGTDVKPIVVGGIIWAPVNVGATTTDASILNQASCGYYFQWGRNVAFTAFALPEAIAGPLSKTQADATDKFILSDNDWLDVRTNNLWYASTNNHPCPSGWIVPTSTPFSAIMDLATNNGYEDTTNSVSITVDGGEKIIFPLAGTMTNVNQNALGINGTYWTQQSNGGDMIWQYQFTQETGVKRYASQRASAFTIRCVKN